MTLITSAADERQVERQVHAHFRQCQIAFFVSARLPETWRKGGWRMSRNHFTKECHKRDRDQLARQEKQLALLARQLRRGITESPAALLLIDAKERRSTRLAGNRLHKPTGAWRTTPIRSATRDQ